MTEPMTEPMTTCSTTLPREWMTITQAYSIIVAALKWNQAKRRYDELVGIPLTKPGRHIDMRAAGEVHSAIFHAEKELRLRIDQANKET